MFLLEPQHLLDLAITQRRLPLIQVPRNRGVWTILLQELTCWERRSNRIIRRIKHLKSQSVFLDTQIANLAQIPCVDVAPRIALAHRRIINVFREIALVLVRLDDVADAQRVNVGVEAARETAGHALAAEFGNGVCVHGVHVVGFVQREGCVVEIALAEADFVGGFGARNNDLFNAEFAGGFDDVVGASYVAGVAFVVLEMVSMELGLGERVVDVLEPTCFVRTRQSG
jgi:hypothetical protein